MNRAVASSEVLKELLRLVPDSFFARSNHFVRCHFAGAFTSKKCSVPPYVCASAWERGTHLQAGCNMTPAASEELKVANTQAV